MPLLLSQHCIFQYKRHLDKENGFLANKMLWCNVKAFKTAFIVGTIKLFFSVFSRKSLTLLVKTSLKSDNFAPRNGNSSKKFLTLVKVFLKKVHIGWNNALKYAFKDMPSEFPFIRIYQRNNSICNIGTIFVYI